MARMTTPRVSVLVAASGSQHLLPEVLRALESQHLRDFRVFLAHPGPANARLEQATRHPLRPTLLEAPPGSGRGALFNRALKSAQDSPYLAFLAADTLPAPGWLAAMVHGLERLPEHGFADSRVHFLYSPDFLDSAGLGLTVSGQPYRRGHRARSGPAWDHPAEIFAARGVASLYRSRVLHEIGGFDEALGSFYEDLDLSWRAASRGHRGVYLPGAGAYHRSEVSLTDADSAYHAEYASRLRVLAKNLEAGIGVLLLPRILLRLLAEGFQAGRKGRFGARTRAEFGLLRNLGDLLRKRQEVMLHASQPLSRFHESLTPRSLGEDWSHGDGRPLEGMGHEFGPVLPDLPAPRPELSRGP